MTFRELLGWWVHWGTGRWYARRGHGSSVPLSPSLPYVPLPFGCSWIESFIINPLTVSKLFSWALWVVLVNYWAWGEGRGNPQFIAFWSETRWSGTWTWHLSGGSPVGLSLLTCGYDASPRWLVSGLRWIGGHPVGVWRIGGCEGRTTTTGVRSAMSKNSTLWKTISFSPKTASQWRKKKKNHLLISQKLSQPKKLEKSFHFQSLHGSERKKQW